MAGGMAGLCLGSRMRSLLGEAALDDSAFARHKRCTWWQRARMIPRARLLSCAAGYRRPGGWVAGSHVSPIGIPHVPSIQPAARHFRLGLLLRACAIGLFLFHHLSMFVNREPSLWNLV